MAGHAGNWFKPRGGALKGQAVYIPKERWKDALGPVRSKDGTFYAVRTKATREEVVVALEAPNAKMADIAAASASPKGVAKRALRAAPARARVDRGTHSGPLREEAYYAKREAQMRKGHDLRTEEMGDPDDDPTGMTGSRGINFTEIAARLGYANAEALEARMTDDLERLVDGSTVVSRVPMGVLEKILDAGFKNQYQVKKSGPGGVYAPELRKEAEETMFGITPGSKPKDYPIYGYLEPKEGNPTHGMDLYGDVRIEFSEALKQRTTFSFSDSLAAHKFVVPAPMAKPRLSALGYYADNFAVPADKPMSVSQIANRSMGFEAQVHGKVNTSDIANITFTNPPAPAMEARLAELGISWRVDPKLTRK